MWHIYFQMSCSPGVGFYCTVEFIEITAVPGQSCFSTNQAATVHRISERSNLSTIVYPQKVACVLVFVYITSYYGERFPIKHLVVIGRATLMYILGIYKSISSP